MVPGWGLSQRLPRLIGIHRAKEFSLTGNYVDAETAERWGLVNHVVAPEDLLQTCLQLAADMSSCVAQANAETKRLIDEGGGMSLGQAMPFENRAATAWARRVSGEQIGSRRAGIVERGRKQSRD